MLFKNSISKKKLIFLKNQPVERTLLRIRIRRIHVFLGLLDPDPSFIGTWGLRILMQFLISLSKNSKINLEYTAL